MYFFQIFPCNVRISLCSTDIRMSEHFLYRPEVGAAVQQVRGKGMPECMRMDVLFNIRLQGILVDDIPNGHAREPASAVV